MKRKPIVLIFTKKDPYEITAHLKHQAELLNDYYFFINPPLEDEKEDIKMLKYSSLNKKERAAIMMFRKKYLTETINPKGE